MSGKVVLLCLLYASIALTEVYSSNHTQTSSGPLPGHFRYPPTGNCPKCLPVCNPNPCLNGGRCQLTASRMDYVCTNCPATTCGKNCEKVICNRGNNCLQFQDKMYFYYEEQSDWQQANDRCTTQGLSMAMPKDQQTTSYLIYELRSRFDQSTNTHFWIGLKPYGSVWTWNDGTPLGDYTGGFPNFKQQLGERWAILWLTGADVWWYPQIYGEIAKSPYFPLCQKSI